MVTWQLQDAKKPTKRRGGCSDRRRTPADHTTGKPVVVMIAAEDYERFRRLAKSAVPSFNELLLQMPQDDGEFARPPLQPRPFDA